MSGFINKTKSFFRIFQAQSEVAVDEGNEINKDDMLACPFCHNQKVAVRFIDKAPDADEKMKRGQETGQCVIIESGVVKKECQSCGYTWDEQDIEETAFIMPKRTNMFKAKTIPKINLSADDFALSVETQSGRRVIMFASNSREFVEVVFTIDGQEVKQGKTYNDQVKGYAYPPGMTKAVKKDKAGRPLIFSPRGGMVKAYIFAGQGRYLDEDLEKPTFMRNQLIQKVKFTRAGTDPALVLKVRY